MMKPNGNTNRICKNYFNAGCRQTNFAEHDRHTERQSSAVQFDITPSKIIKPAVPEMDITPKTLEREILTIVADNSKKMSAEQQVDNLKNLILLAQNGDKEALTNLCAAFEPLFRKEMRRDIFYKGLGFDEGLSLARLKFIELVLTYNGADYEHFAGYVRCRIHFALYDEVKKAWAVENKKAPLPQSDEAESAEFADNIIEREELNILLKLALQKLTAKQRQAIEALYIDGFSNKETAKLLNCTPAMVTKHHKQALKSLKNKIA